MISHSMNKWEQLKNQVSWLNASENFYQNLITFHQDLIWIWNSILVLFFIHQKWRNISTSSLMPINQINWKEERNWELKLTEFMTLFTSTLMKNWTSLLKSKNLPSFTNTLSNNQIMNLWKRTSKNQWMKSHENAWPH